jgi:hypothetical protein
VGREAEDEGRGDLCGVCQLRFSRGFPFAHILMSRSRESDAYRVIRPIARGEVNEGGHDVSCSYVELLVVLEYGK